MSDILLVYWSGTGNTKKMAELIMQGIKEAGVSVDCKEVSMTDEKDVEDYNTIIMGSPSMGAEVLEETEMEPFVSLIEGKLKGKNIALFGSYGWGSGEWMDDWHNRLSETGAKMIFDQGLIVQDEPSGELEEECVQFGRNVAKAI